MYQSAFLACEKVLNFDRGTIQKNASFLRNCPKIFFARFHIFNDLFFIQHNFFFQYLIRIEKKTVIS